MKRMVLGIVLVLAAFGPLTSAAVAAPDPQAAPVLSAADQAFLAALAIPEAAAPTSAARRPGLIGKDACSATVNCGNGTSVSCSGTTASGCTGAQRNCASGEHGHVTCNGVSTYCSNLCPCEISEQQCESTCNGCYKSFSCTPYRCVCGPPCA